MGNIELMTATEAFNETAYRNEANTILRDMATSIYAAISAGRYCTEVNVDSRTSKGAIDLVLKELVNKGYKADFCLDTHAACEHYWDRITINWKGDN